MNLRKDHLHILNNSIFHEFVSCGGGLKHLSFHHLLEGGMACFCKHFHAAVCFMSFPIFHLVLLMNFTTKCVFAMNVLAQLMMKNAAKCDMHCELQNSVSQ